MAVPMDEPIASMVEGELGETPVTVGRIDEGLIHETYEVRCGGTEYVLQLSDAGGEGGESLRRGLGCYRLLADSVIPVPSVVTETVRTDDGWEYVLVEKLPGTSGTLDVSPERARNAGRYLAEIHEVRRFERAGWLRFDDGGASVEAFEEGGLDEWRRRKLRDNVAYLRAGGLEAAGRGVQRLLDREDLPSTDAFQPVLCHNDYSPDNVLFRDGEVTGILDFDHAYVGDRHRDVAKAANGFWMHDPCADWDVRETVYDGYCDVADLGSAFEETEPRHRVETLAVGVGGMARMDELSEYEREFYDERILEAIERVSRT